MDNNIKLDPKIEREFYEIFDHLYREAEASVVEDLDVKLREFIADQLAKERERVVKELEDIETKNHDKELDTLDFDSFAEDVCIWLQRNKSHD